MAAVSRLIEVYIHATHAQYAIMCMYNTCCQIHMQNSMCFCHMDMHVMTTKPNQTEFACIRICVRHGVGDTLRCESTQLYAHVCKITRV
jgi:hypothetical protein